MQIGSNIGPYIKFTTDAPSWAISHIGLNISYEIQSPRFILSLRLGKRHLTLEVQFTEDDLPF